MSSQIFGNSLDNVTNDLISGKDDKKMTLAKTIKINRSVNM